MNNFKVLIMGSVFLSCAGTSAAKQVIPVKDGDTVMVTISARELTRFSAVGNATAITDIWSADPNLFDTHVDEGSGSIFMKPKPRWNDGYAGGLDTGEGGLQTNGDSYSASAFSFFVKDDTGAIYTAVAKSSDIPSETVMFNSVGSMRSVSESYGSSGAEIGEGSVEDRKANVRNLVKSMYLDEPEYLINKMNYELNVWRETAIYEIGHYLSDDLKGVKYRVINLTGEDLIISEQEFTGFIDDVVAVSIDERRLSPKGQTYVYIVAKNQYGAN